MKVKPNIHIIPKLRISYSYNIKLHCVPPPPPRQHKLEEALLFSGQFAEALQALVDWLYRVEPQLAEDQPVHGDLDLVSNLMDSHKVCVFF